MLKNSAVCHSEGQRSSSALGICLPKQAVPLKSRFLASLGMTGELLFQHAASVVSRKNVTYVWSALSEADQTFELLNKTCDGRLALLLYLKVNPIFDNLRADPRFHQLVQRVGLP